MDGDLWGMRNFEDLGFMDEAGGGLRVRETVPHGVKPGGGDMFLDRLERKAVALGLKLGIGD
jgi:hypothetical protein